MFSSRLCGGYRIFSPCFFKQKKKKFFLFFFLGGVACLIFSWRRVRRRRRSWRFFGGSWSVPIRSERSLAQLVGRRPGPQRAQCTSRAGADCAAGGARARLPQPDAAQFAGIS